MPQAIDETDTILKALFGHRELGRNLMKRLNLDFHSFPHLLMNVLLLVIIVVGKWMMPSTLAMDFHCSYIKKYSLISKLYITNMRISNSMPIHHKVRHNEVVIPNWMGNANLFLAQFVLQMVDYLWWWIGHKDNH